MGRPPRLATWLLARLTTGPHAEALIGDLVESYAHRQSAAWFWWQTLGAIAFGIVSDLRSRYGFLLPVAFLVGFAAASVLGTIKLLPGLTLLDQMIAGFGAGWLACRVGGPAAAFVFTIFVLLLGVPETSLAVMSFLDHFRGLWLLAHFGAAALPASIALAVISIVVGAVAGARGVSATRGASPA